MICVSCGAEVAENFKFCIACGAPVVKQETPTPVVEPVIEEIPVAAPVAPAEAAPVVPPVAPPVAAPVPPVYVPPVAMPQQAVLPRENKPLSSWAYFGWKLLFSIPLFGFVFLVILSLDNSNINRRNFARSYWCGLLIGVVLTIVVVVLLLTLVGAEETLSLIEDML